MWKQATCYFLFCCSAILFFNSCNSSHENDTDRNKKHYSVLVADKMNHTAKKSYRNKGSFYKAYDKALQLFQVPFSEKYVKTKYGIAHVIVCGAEDDNEPLVLLHGMNATSTMWYPNIKSLATNHKVYVIDFILEPGKSIQEKEIDDTQQIIDWYYEIFDKLNLQQINLIGASRGGWIAMNLAISKPNRVKKLILLSPAQSFVWIKLEPKVIKNIIYTLSPNRENLRSVLETMTTNVDNISQDYLDQYFIASQQAKINKCFIQMRPFSDADLAKISSPVLLLIGDADIVNNQKSLNKANEKLKNVVTKTLTNAGHFLSIDQAEQVNKEINNFLDKK